LDISWSIIQKAVREIKPAPGRIEFIKESEKLGFKVVVDYAFEPNALAGLYKATSTLSPQKIIHVCGSTGGGRDKSRREPIGRLIGEKADVVIVTNEDPYDEDPVEIIKQVSLGAQKVGKILGVNLFEILDRKEAIKRAVTLAQKGDIVLITGKGSEQAMCVKNGERVPWDDRKIASEVLQTL
jgi:UDP-N-acetylmuramoyl-L-alanyl-D-glutamate--2,6-diaminopimelate ligase